MLLALIERVVTPLSVPPPVIVFHSLFSRTTFFRPRDPSRFKERLHLIFFCFKVSFFMTSFLILNFNLVFSGHLASGGVQSRLKTITNLTRKLSLSNSRIIENPSFKSRTNGIGRTINHSIIHYSPIFDGESFIILLKKFIS